MLASCQQGKAHWPDMPRSSDCRGTIMKPSAAATQPAGTGAAMVMERTLFGSNTMSDHVDRARVIRFAGTVPLGDAGVAADRGRHQGPHFVEWAATDSPRAVAAIELAGRRYRSCVVGTILNAADIAVQLSARGARPRSATADEVLALSYLVWGKGCAERLRGDFAGFVWDEQTNELLLIRDRIGVRSVFVRHAHDRFSFASDLAALRAVDRVPLEIDPEAIDVYLALRTVPAPLSIYRSVGKLQAGHVIACRSGVATSSRYWEPSFRRTPPSELEATIERFDALLEDAIDRLRDRNGLGVLLSAGPDSALILALLSHQGRSPMRTLSFAFKGGFDELAGARRTAEHFGARHTEIDVDPRVADFLPVFIEQYDEPNANGSALFWSKVKHLAANHVDALASGEGADEAFGGRDRHLAMGIISGLHRFPGRHALTIAARLIAATGAGLVGAEVLASAARAPLERHLGWLSLFASHQRTALYAPPMRAQIVMDRLRPVLEHVFPAAAHPLDQAFAVDLGLWVPEVVQPTLAGRGAEILAPFLDDRIVDLAAALPPSLKARVLTTKRFLRRVYAARLPPWLNRARRRGGVSIPLAPLLRGELRPVVEDCLLSPGALIAQYLDSAAVRVVAQGADRQREPAAVARLWALLILELWLRRERDRAVADRGAHIR